MYIPWLIHELQKKLIFKHGTVKGDNSVWSFPSKFVFDDIVIVYKLLIFTSWNIRKCYLFKLTLMWGFAGDTAL